MLDDAYELPDGRRVFKTEDGLRVFDEHGVEVGASDVLPDAIEDYRPSWEAFSAEQDRRTVLVTKQRDLLDYQDHLDDAQQRLDQGGLSAQEVQELDDLLTGSAPDEVRAILPESDAASAAPSLETSNDLDLFAAGLDDTPSSLPSLGSKV